MAIEPIVVEFSFEEILMDIINKKSGDCDVADRAEYWLEKLRKTKHRSKPRGSSMAN